MLATFKFVPYMKLCIYIKIYKLWITYHYASTLISPSQLSIYFWIPHFPGDKDEGPSQMNRHFHLKFCLVCHAVYKLPQYAQILRRYRIIVTNSGLNNWNYCGSFPFAFSCFVNFWWNFLNLLFLYSFYLTIFRWTI